MTHSAAAVKEVARLASESFSASEISRKTAIPRRTIVDWLAGRTPRPPEQVRVARRLPPGYVYLLGLYLGDGCISSHPRGVFRLRITLDAKYPNIIAECAQAIREVLPRNAVACLPRKYGDVEVSCYSKAWPLLFPQHGPGKKHLRPIALAEWQQELVARNPELLLRGLIQSDGCRFQNTGSGGWRHPRYSFYNYSHDIRAIFCAVCDQLELGWTASKYTVYVSRKADVKQLDRWVGPKS